ncbi:TPA: hypothetical protein R6C92_003642 [Pseudomonas aeruginosa]|nr:hypothetical protein [Pseudomonas aeruginosa]
MTRSNAPLCSSEAELCAAFIDEFNRVPGWTCYPETAGFDILVVHEEGRQIGVEAKLQLNAKVADQILPQHWQDRYGAPGPDHRMVIVGRITEASQGIARLLEMCGIAVLAPSRGHRRRDGKFVDFPEFHLRHWLQHLSGPQLFDWNPAERCHVPIVVPDVPAGVPAPLRLTEWKEGALKVIATLRRQGFITTKQIAECGVSATNWTRSWLDKGAERGTWVESARMPAFDQQHPEAYAKLQQLDQAKPGAQHRLALAKEGEA